MSALTSSVAVVTGAARGIGRETVEALRAAGATVVGVDVDPGVKQLGDAVVADLAVEPDVLRVVREVTDQHGRIDILVNNAGLGRHNPIPDIRTADLDLMWA